MACDGEQRLEGLVHPAFATIKLDDLQPGIRDPGERRSQDGRLAEPSGSRQHNQRGRLEQCRDQRILHLDLGSRQQDVRASNNLLATSGRQLQLTTTAL